MQTFKLWRPGAPNQNKAQWSGMPIFMDRIEAETFDEAVVKYISELPVASRGLYTKKEDGYWYWADVLRICSTTDEAKAFTESLEAK